MAKLSDLFQKWGPSALLLLTAIKDSSKLTLEGAAAEMAKEKVKEKTSSAVKNLVSQGDEQEYERMLQALEAQEGMQGARKLVVEFTQWQFPKDCIGEKMFSWWYGNHFRTFVVGLNKLNSEEGKKPEEKAGLVFLTWMVKTIRDETDNLGSQELAFQALAKQLDHVPHMPESAARNIAQAQKAVDKIAHEAFVTNRALGIAAVRLERENAQRAAKPKGWWRKFTDI